MNKIKKLLSKLRHKFPSPLPVGMSELDAYCESVCTLYDLPNLRSYQQAIATMILHQPPTKAKIPKEFFANCVKKAMANEVAFNKIQTIKESIENEEKAAKELAALEMKKDESASDEQLTPISNQQEEASLSAPEPVV